MTNWSPNVATLDSGSFRRENWKDSVAALMVVTGHASLPRCLRNEVWKSMKNSRKHAASLQRSGSALVQSSLPSRTPPRLRILGRWVTGEAYTDAFAAPGEALH